MTTKTQVILLLMVFNLCFFSCQINKSIEVPTIVLESFEVKYPNEKDPSWEIDAHNNFEAHFKIEGVKHRADFLPSGEWVETEISISKKELPEAIKQKIKENYSYYKITEIEKVSNALKGEFYDVEFKQKGKNKDVEFRVSGEEL